MGRDKTLNFNKQIKKPAKTDEWYTPSYAVEIILPYLNKKPYRHVWCPFDTKDSEFVKILNREGYNVTYGHIDTGQDFFNYVEPPEGVECVVSNPPFSNRQLIFEKLFGWRIPFAVIMNSNGLFDNRLRWSLFKNNKFELLIPQGRIKFSDGTKLRHSPPFQSIYVCSQFLDKQIEFTNMNKNACSYTGRR